MTEVTLYRTAVGVRWARGLLVGVPGVAYPGVVRSSLLVDFIELLGLGSGV